MRDIMLDLETLSTERDAAVIQIGACAFDLDKGIGPHDMPVSEAARLFRVTIDMTDAMRYGHVDGGTIMWWMSQSEEARRSVCGAAGEMPVLLGYALEHFSSWTGRHTREAGDPTQIRLWAGPSDFDHPILRNAYRQTGLPVPWDRRSVRDSKTILDAAQSFGVELYKPPTTVAHDALADAIWQAEQLLVMWRGLRARVAG